VALGVLGVVAPVPVGLILRLGMDRRAGLARAGEVRVDVVHVDVRHVGEGAEVLRAAKVRAGMAEEDLAVPEYQFRVRDRPVVVCVAEPLLEPERLREPVDRGGDVLVEQVGRDGLHARLPGVRPGGMRIMALTTERGWSDFDFRQYGQWR
jgi:hypothetical protein